MMMKARRVIALLLTGIFLFTLAVPAFAVDEESEIREAPPTESSTGIEADPLGTEPGPDLETNTAPKWGSDYETAESFTIDSKEDFLAFAALSQAFDEENWQGYTFEGKTVALEADIDLTGETIAPIGTDANGYNMDGFAGTFDGGGHTISGVTIQLTEEMKDNSVLYCGLFGQVGGEIKDLNLAQITVENDDVTGGIAGVLSGTMNNCHIIDSTIVGGGSVGGIVGQADGTVTNCTADADTSVKGAYNVGGIVGELNAVSIANCTNYAAVQPSDASEAKHSSFGGIAGIYYQNLETRAIDSCVNYGMVDAEGHDYVGGIVGLISAKLTVTNCTNAGQVNGGNNVGGISGIANVEAEIMDCLNTGDVTGKENVGGITGKLSNQKQKEIVTAPKVEKCYISGVIAGESNVGTVAGQNLNAANGETAASIAGCIVLPAAAASGASGQGAIIGDNASDGEMPSVITNCLWPSSLGEAPAGLGTGSAEGESSEAVKNNSAYELDGTLVTPIAPESGETIDNLGKAIDQVFSAAVPDLLKATATFKNNGYGTAPAAQEVTMGTKITLPDLQAGSYSLSGWQCGTETYTAHTEVAILRDTTFAAQWKNTAPSSYPINISGGIANGSILVNPASAEQGSIITITVKPNDTYKLETLTAADKNAKALTLTNKGGGIYTFTMPASAVSIQAAFTVIENPAVVVPAEPETKAETGGMTEDEKTIAQAAAKKAAEKPAVDTETLTNMAQEKADNNPVSKEAGLTALKDKQIAAEDTEMSSVTIVVQPYMEIIVKDVEVADTAKTLTLEITPKYQTLATTADPSKDKIVVAKEGETVSNANAVKVEEGKLDVQMSVEMVIPLPDDFTTANALYVTHQKENNRAYVYRGSVSNNVLTFTNPHGFSTFVMSASNPALVEIDGTGYMDVQQAFDEVADGGTITILQANVTATISGSKTFKVAGTGAATLKLGVASGYTLQKNADGSYTVKAVSPSGGGSSGGSSGSSSVNYPVSLPAAIAHGSVAVSPQNAVAGRTVTLTVTPEAGWSLDRLSVTDKDGKTLTLTNQGSGKYTFTMPASKVSVQASFVQGKAPAVTGLPFADVASGAWYQEAVAYVYEKGLMTGTSTAAFSPDMATTRGMIMTILYRMENEPAVDGTSSFTDVAADAYYTKAVAWAAANNIVSGYGDGLFGPDNAVTREQMASIFYRYALYKGYDVSARADLSGFADADQISGYAQDTLAWAKAKQLIGGTSAATLDPAESATRAQVAAILMRFCETIVK